MASVWAHRSSENTTETQWRVCIYHSAPSEDGLPRHFFQTQTLGAKLDFVHRVGFGFAAFVFHGFQTTCFRIHFHQIQRAADAQFFRRHMHRPLKTHTLARFRLARIFAAMILCAIGTGFCSDTRCCARRNSTLPKQKICPIECTGNCATFLRSCSTTSVSRSLCR